MYIRILFIALLTILAGKISQASELVFKMNLCEISIAQDKKVEINLINGVSVDQITKAKHPSSTLKVQYKMTFDKEKMNRIVYSGELSEQDIKNISGYTFNSGLSLFGGLIESKVEKNGWSVSFNEAMSRNEVARVSMTEIEYKEFIQVIKKSSNIKDALQENWNKISNIHKITNISIQK